MPAEQVVLGGRYLVGELLGSGGMAEVRRGVDTRLGRQVAIKQLGTALASESTSRQRFRREAHAAARLNHPNVVAVFDTGEESDPITTLSVPYIVMELVEGRTLRDEMSAAVGRSPVRALDITGKVLDALIHSHDAGIIHRDIKPSNVMVTPDGDIKVMDFGIARALTNATSSTLTDTAAVVGTANYLSPEQARGDKVDARSDLYSVGCVLFELLVSRPPFSGDTQLSIIYQHVHVDPVSPSDINPEVSPTVSAIALRALAKDPDQRYQDAREMKAAVTTALAIELGIPAELYSGNNDTTLAKTTASTPTQSTPRPLASTVTPSSTPVPGSAPPVLDAPAVAGTGSAAADPAQPNRRRRLRRRALLLTLISALVLAGGFVAFREALNQAGLQTMSRVPDVVGSSKDKAARDLDGAGLQADFTDVHGPNNDTVNTVIHQTVRPGDHVPRGSTIALQVNVGPATGIIPKGLVGKDADLAVDALTAVGFTNVKLIRVAPDVDGVDDGEVVTINPSEGETIPLDQPITIAFAGATADAGESPDPTSSGDTKNAGGAGPGSPEGQTARPPESSTTRAPSRPSSGATASTEEPSAGTSDSEPSQARPAEDKPTKAKPTKAKPTKAKPTNGKPTKDKPSQAASNP